MKKLAALTIITSLLLSACGTSLYVIDDETLDTYPELESLASDWQELTEAAVAEDCELVSDYMRLSTDFTAEDCPAIFEYFEDGLIAVEWEKTEWNASMGKAKLYELNQGSIGGFILNEAENIWGAEDRFWE